MDFHALPGFLAALGDIEPPLGLALLAFPAGLIVGDRLRRVVSLSPLMAVIVTVGLVLVTTLHIAALMVMAPGWPVLALAVAGGAVGANGAEADRRHDWHSALETEALRRRQRRLDRGRLWTVLITGAVVPLLVLHVAHTDLLTTLVVAGLTLGTVTLPSVIRRIRDRRATVQDRHLERWVGLAVSSLLPVAVAWEARPAGFPLAIGLALGVLAWCVVPKERSEPLLRTTVVAILPVLCTLLGTAVLILSHRTVPALAGGALLGLGMAPLAVRPRYVDEGRPEHYYRVLALMVLIGFAVGA